MIIYRQDFGQKLHLDILKCIPSIFNIFTVNKYQSDSHICCYGVPEVMMFINENGFKGYRQRQIYECINTYIIFA